MLTTLKLLIEDYPLMFILISLAKRGSISEKVIAWTRNLSQCPCILLVTGLVSPTSGLWQKPAPPMFMLTSLPKCRRASEKTITWSRNLPQCSYILVKTAHASLRLDGAAIQIQKPSEFITMELYSRIKETLGVNDQQEETNTPLSASPQSRRTIPPTPVTCSPASTASYYCLLLSG